MDLEFIDIDLKYVKPKATIHMSGRLGFNSEAAKVMKLKDKRYFKVALSKAEGIGNGNIYLIDDEHFEGTAKVSKAGDYYYLNVGGLFDNIGVDYKGFSIIYDIKKEQYGSKDMFALKQRKPKPRGDKKQDNNED